MRKPRVKIEISDYRYGKVYKRLRNAVEWINSNNAKIDCPNLEVCLPKRIYNKLMPEEWHFLLQQTSDRRDWFLN